MNSQSPDQREYTAHDIALLCAGIDPRRCGGCVYIAEQKLLTGFENALQYYEEIMMMVESGDLVPVRIKGITATTFLPPPLATYPESTSAKRRTVTATIRRHIYFDYETACSYRPGMSFRNPLMIDSPEPEKNRELEKSYLLLGCLMMGFLNAPKYETVQARADFLKGLADKYLKNNWGFADTSMRQLVAHIDDLVKEKGK